MAQGVFFSLDLFSKLIEGLVNVYFGLDVGRQAIDQLLLAIAVLPRVTPLNNFHEALVKENMVLLLR